MLSFGTELRVCDANGITVSETLMPRGLTLAEHVHAAGQICFVLEGSYRESLPCGERLLQPGMVHVRAPGEPHANAFSRDDDALTLLISIDASRWLRHAGGQPMRMLADVAADMRAEIRRGDDVARTALEALSLLTLSRLARVRPGEPEWLSDAESLIESRFAGPLSLAGVASAIGVPRTTLAIAFRRHRGTSVGQAIRDARIRHAKRMMGLGAPLAEIAEAAGFFDQPHFTRVFRAATGMTPRQYAISGRSLRSE